MQSLHNDLQLIELWIKKPQKGNMDEPLCESEDLMDYFPVVTCVEVQK